MSLTPIHKAWGVRRRGKNTLVATYWPVLIINDKIVFKKVASETSRYETVVCPLTKGCSLSCFPHVTYDKHRHKVVSVSISAPKSLAFDPKGCCSQHRMKECIVPVSLTSLSSHQRQMITLKKADTGWSTLFLCFCQRMSQHVLVTALNRLNKTLHFKNKLLPH